MDKLSAKGSKSSDKSRNNSKDSKDDSREHSKDKSGESSKDKSREGSKNKSKESSKDKSREGSKDKSREDSKEKSKSSGSSNSKQSSKSSSKHSKDEEDKNLSKASSKESKKSSKGSTRSNSRSDSRINSEDKDRSTKSADEKRLRMSKQQYTEHELSSEDDSFSERLEDEEKKLLKELEDEVTELNKDQSRKHSVDYERIPDQHTEQNLSNLSFDSPDLNFSLNSSEKEKLIKNEDRKIERGRSSSLFPIDRRGLRNKFARSSQVSIDGNLTMQIDGEKRRLSSSFLWTLFKEETAIQMPYDEPMTEEKMETSIKTARQIIANTKTQEWPIHKKLKYLKNAKQYLKKHEGDMKQSSQAKDILAVYRAYIEKAFRRLRREIDNLVVQLTPWELRIKRIESQFGSVVASYFTFLRWIFWINTFVGLAYCIFVMVPEIILFERKNYNSSRGLRKIKEEVDKPFLSTISDINEFEGFLKFSPIFYGYYDTDDEAPNLDFYYPLPLIYFVLTLVLFLSSFFFILRKMAQNSKLQRVGSKEDEFTFCWKLYTGWDFMIGNSETAHNKIASIIMSFKEIILEEREKKKEVRNWKLIAKRIFANLLVLVILCSSAYAVVLVVERSQRIEASNFFQRNEVSFLFTGLSFVCPFLFTQVAKLEDHHPRIALRWQLGRILVLNILNFVCLLLSTFQKVHSQLSTLREIKENLTILYTLELEENKTLDLSSFVTQSVLSSAVTMTALVREKRKTNEEGEGRLFPPLDDRKQQSTTKPPHFLQAAYYEEQLEGRLIKPKFIDKTNFFENLTSIYNQSTDKPIDALFTPTTTTTFRPLNITFPPLKVTPRPIIGEQQTRKPPLITRRTTTTFRPPIIITKPTTKIKQSDDNTTEPTSIIYPVDDNSTSSDTQNSTEIEEQPITKRRRPTVLMTTTQSPNCNQEELFIDPFKLFEFAQKLEKEGFNNYTTTLKGLCWETSFGQELVKLTLTDLYMTILASIFVDYFRAVLVRYCNGLPCCCCDIEMKWPKYADFSIAENILSLTNSQGMIWLGMFFAPGLPIINSFKLYLMMYFKSWAVLTSNVPHSTVFKASGNNNFYYFLLLLMLFLATLPVAYCLVWFEPSWHCGPYSNYHSIYHIMTKKLEQKLPNNINKMVEYVSSSAFIIPMIMFKILIIYYMYTQLASLQESARSQLRKDKDNSVLDQEKEGSIGSISSMIDSKKVRIDEQALKDEKSESEKDLIDMEK